MREIRIDATVSSDHKVTIQLPADVPAGPAEVILIYNGPTSKVDTEANGPAILNALSHSRHSVAGFLNGASDEIREARDAWDAD